MNWELIVAIIASLAAVIVAVPVVISFLRNGGKIAGLIVWVIPAFIFGLALGISINTWAPWEKNTDHTTVPPPPGSLKDTLLSRDWWYWPWPGERWMTPIAFKEMEDGTLQAAFTVYIGEKTPTGGLPTDTVLMKGVGKVQIKGDCFKLVDVKVLKYELAGKTPVRTEQQTLYSTSIDGICPTLAFQGKLQYPRAGEGDILVTAHQPDIFNPPLPSFDDLWR
ncbi:MAG: hypothetical protein FJ316_09945 [SAR202 cluster bacterium]|nr:hypothetical protein [SAR202 cluster bacterium]